MPNLPDSLVILFVGAFFVGLGVGSEFEVKAQAPVVTTIMPPLGEAVDGGKSAESEFPGNPVNGGMSFDVLKDLIKAFVDQERRVTRGAREIAVFRQAAPAVVLIKTQDGSGSGVVLENKMVLTNRHVVEGVGMVQLFFKPDDLSRDGAITETRSGTVKAVDRQRDLALIAPESLPANVKILKIATRDDLEVGADVYAIGHPLGYTWTFTQGIVSGMRTINTDEQHYTAVQTQTPINPGNSGGPLLNSDMEVVGINTWARDISTFEKKKVTGEEVQIARPAQGLNFAVSARDLRAFVADVKNGKFANLALQMPSSPPGCSGEMVFNGRTKANDAGLKTFSLRCDHQADTWELFPDDKTKPVEYHLDPDRRGKGSIVIFSTSRAVKWDFSLWDLFRDQSFAVMGRHDDGKLRPTRFEYAKR